MCFDPISVVLVGLYSSTLASDSAHYQQLSRSKWLLLRFLRWTKHSSGVYIRLNLVQLVGPNVPTMVVS